MKGRFLTLWVDLNQGEGQTLTSCPNYEKFGLAKLT